MYMCAKKVAPYSIGKGSSLLQIVHSERLYRLAEKKPLKIQELLVSLTKP